MQQSQTQYELCGVLLAQILFLLSHSGQYGQVVMAAEVEVEHFLNFTFYHFGDIEMIRTFAFVGIHIF